MPFQSMFEVAITSTLGVTVGAVTWVAKTLIRHDADIGLLKAELVAGRKLSEQSQKHIAAALDRLEEGQAEQQRYCRLVTSRVVPHDPPPHP